MQRTMIGRVAGLALGVVLGAQAWGASTLPKVSIDTSEGTIVVELYPVKAPRTVANFLHYVHSGFYNGLIFHRVIPGFMIQGGGFDVRLNERPTDAPIPNEAANGLKNEAGTLAMARTNELDSATSQFFINVVDNPILDHVDVPPEGLTLTRAGSEVHIAPAQANQVYGYAVFGRVISGMNVVKAIEKVHTNSVGMMQDVPETPVVIRSMTESP